MIYYENSRFGNIETCDYNTIENMTFGFHLHRCYEFIYVLEGSITVTINKDVFELSEKNAAIILSNHIHSYFTENYSKIFICIFSPDSVRVFDNMVSRKTTNMPILNCSDDIQNIIESLEKTSKDDILNLKSCLYRLSAIIYEKITFVEQNSSDSDLLHLLLQYIQENYKQDITLLDISSSLNYDYHYLSRFFNKNVGISFKEFLNSHRINFCVEQLIDTKKSVSEIALNGGFNNVRCLNRCFKDIMGITPSEYRKNKIELQEK
jgi:YesN/AraC family two-component response regulator